MKLNLDVVAKVAEIGTAIVVVVSLVIIALELDRNTRATHSASWEAVLDLMVSLDQTEATELGMFIDRAEEDPASVSEEEYWRFSRIVQARLGVMEYAFLGIQNDTLSQFHWGAVSGYLEFNVCKPGYRKYWTEHGEQIYHPEFVAYVEQVLRSCAD